MGKRILMFMCSRPIGEPFSPLKRTMKAERRRDERRGCLKTGSISIILGLISLMRQAVK